MPLTRKRERFVAEYLVDMNATQAAIRAGYSPHTANEQGSRLLANASVHAEVEARSQKQVEAAIDSAQFIIDHAAAAARGALEARQYGAVASNLAILARRHPEFSEKHDVNVDIRAQMLNLVAEMSEDELRAAKERIE